MSRGISVPTPVSYVNTDMSTRWALDLSNVNKFIEFLNNPDYYDTTEKLYNDPINNLISLTLYPIDFEALLNLEPLNVQPIRVGTVTAQSAHGYRLGGSQFPDLDMGSVTISRHFNNFLDFAPYTKIEMFLPFIGIVQLDNDLVMGKTVKIRYVLDLYTGNVTAFILTGTGNNETVIMTREGKMGVQIPIIGGSGSQIARALKEYKVNTAVNALGTVTTGITSAVTVSPQGVAGTLDSAAKTIAGIELGKITANHVNVSKIGEIGETSAMYAPMNAFIIYTRPKVAKPLAYNNLVGRVCAQTNALSQFTGFTVVETAHIEGSGFAQSVKEERDEIARLLHEGVIL